MPADADLATLSVGGNNIGFGDVVESCVYRFHPFDKECDAALTDAEAAIQNVLASAVSNTINKILTDNTVLTLYVTGYVKFWNAVTTQCDTVSFNFWDTIDKVMMTQALRDRMNKGTAAANGVIKGEVGRIAGQTGRRIFFVDVDTAFEGHRFCEEGVTEPQPKGEPRPDTWIFQLNTPIGSVVDAKTTLIYANALNKASDNQKSSDALLVQNPAYPAITLSPDLTTLPMVLTKLFHPTTNGHASMASNVFAAINAPAPAPVPARI